MPSSPQENDQWIGKLHVNHEILGDHEFLATSVDMSLLQPRIYLYVHGRLTPKKKKKNTYLIIYLHSLRVNIKKNFKVVYFCKHNKICPYTEKKNPACNIDSYLKLNWLK